MFFNSGLWRTLRATTTSGKRISSPPPLQKLTAARPPKHPALPYFLPYVVPVLTYFCQRSTAAWHALLPAVFVWAFIPLVDFYVGPPSQEPTLTPTQRRALERRVVFRIAILLWPLAQFVSLFWGAILVTTRGADLVRDFGLVSSLALIAGGGVNCAHELLHRRSLLETGLARLLLVSVCYGHFYIEHARGHHKTVATPEDPATLAYGASFYSFLPRTIVGGFLSAWRLEAKRLRLAGARVWSPRNEMLWFIIAPPVLFIAPLGCTLGRRAVGLFLAQALWAVVLLEQINAMEHYGLTRAKLPGGGYEPVAACHSWDAPHVVSNYLLFKLQRHADHHLHAGKRYQVLELSAESPQLPAGYLTLAPCLLFPPLWRAVMDPVLTNYKKRCRASKISR